MRIELPFPSWAEAQRVHEDAHTLTVPMPAPAQCPHPLLAPLAALRPGQEAAVARVEIAAGPTVALTLTF